MYTPNNTPVYLRAFAGFMGGIASSANTDTQPGDYTAYGQMADAWAQQVDTQWGLGAPTQLELFTIEEASEAIWENRSPLPGSSAFAAGSYTQPAQAVVARVRQGNAQVVSEGIDPNATGSPGTGTVTVVTASPPLQVTGGATTTPNVSLQPNLTVAAGVATGAALTALPVAPLLQGASAFVASYGAYFSLQPVQPLAADQVLASSSGALVWVRVLTAIGYLASLQANWHINAASGNNEANGLSSGTAVKSFSEIVRRYGTTSPTLAQLTTYFFDGDNVETDQVYFVPILVGAGGVVLQGTLIPLGTVTIGTYTARDRAAGTPGQINVAAQSWTGGTTCHDITTNAQFWIDADLGSGSARITEPVGLPIHFIPTRTAIATGNTVNLFRPSTLYVNYINAITVGTGAGGGAIVNQLTITGDTLVFIGPQFALQECALNQCLLQGTSETGNRAVYASCWFGTFFGGGLFGGYASIFFGALNGTGNSFGQGSILDGDVLFNLRGHYSGDIFIGAAYFGQWFTNTGGIQGLGGIAVGETNSGVAAVWGPATIIVNAGQQLVLNDSNITAVGALLTTGGITIDGQSTAFPWDPTTHSFLAAVATTPANIDLYGGLRNPVTGSAVYLFEG